MVYSNVLKQPLEEKQWRLVKYVQALIRPLGIAGMLFGFVALAGYFGSVDVLYRHF